MLQVRQLRDDVGLRVGTKSTKGTKDTKDTKGRQIKESSRSKSIQIVVNFVPIVSFVLAYCCRSSGSAVMIEATIASSVASKQTPAMTM
jgi:hypothetical protein